MSAATPQSPPPVAVIVPVYRGLAETRRCLESVLSSPLPADTRVLVVDDASPEPELARYCDQLAQTGRVELLRNRDNLGFVGSVNRAMAHCAACDVLLLNSDCQVANDWLVRLHNAAYRDNATATVTPFSNNATICSYPRFCADNPLPAGLDTGQLDNIFSQVNAGQSCILPTAVGFCMYIRRACLDQIGLFDRETFGRGYGEENDFCLRASAVGWQHRLAADVFVFHQGSVSFAGDKAALVARAEAAVQRKHPEFFTQVREFIDRDPIAPWRRRVTAEIQRRMPDSDAARELISVGGQSNNAKQEDSTQTMSVASDRGAEIERALHRLSDDPRPRLLFISHAWGGGVEQHVQQLTDLLQRDYAVVVLRGLGQSGVELDIPEGEGRVCYRAGGFGRNNLGDWVAFLQPFAFVRLHLHHIHGWPPELPALIAALALPYDVTLHDYFAISPGYHRQEKNSEPVLANPSWPASVEQWIAALTPLLENAERVIAPSQSVADAVKAAIPRANYQVMAHPELVQPPGRLIKVALLGALSPIKGLALVRRVVAAAAAAEPRLAFTLIGHSAEPLDDIPIRVTGSYDNAELPRLLALEKPDLVWLPSQAPETYSFTLSHALAAGLPVVASATGALAERLAAEPKARLLPPDAPAEQWIDALLAMAPKRSAKTIAKIDTRDSYRRFYTAPVKKAADAAFDATAAGRFLANLPPPPREKDTSVKDLFRIAVYGGHRSSLAEFERRLEWVPGEDVGLAGELELREAEQEIHALEVQLSAAGEALDRYQDNLDIAKANIQELQAQAGMAKEHIDHLEEKVGALEANCRQLEWERDLLLNSFSWKVTRPLRVASRLARRVLRLLRTLARHALRPSSWLRALRLIRLGQWRLLLGAPAPAETEQESGGSPVPRGVDRRLLESNELLPEPLALDTSDAPQVSIVVPVYGQHATTYGCLKSLADNPPAVPWELLVMDDCSPEPAEQALSSVNGATFVRHPENLGFLENVNAGVRRAKGAMVVILNNDTVLCPGAIDQMLSVFASRDRVGLVGAKLLNRNGTIQEAGGIVWRDGSAWNWGRNADRRDPRFNYLREVDYCSGAALAVERQVFLDMGGFDTHYKPAYYEDTDLAFRMRQRGLRVIYQPAAEIYHLEGVSHGRDEKNGIKAYQQINAEKFYRRWKEQLSVHRENALAPEREANRYSRGHILVVDACMLRPDQDSGSLRMFNLLSLLLDEGYRVTFVADNLEYREKYVRQLQAIGVQVYHGAWVNSVRQLLRRQGDSLDCIFFCRHYVACHYMDLARRYAPRARLVFDTVDLHFVREEREAQLLADPLLQRTAAATRRQELALVEKADVTLVVSSFEQELLGKLLPDASVEIVSNIHVGNPERPGYRQRRDILFVGGFQHTPNIDAIQWYAQEVMPHLRELLPGVVTRVVGSRMPDEIEALDSEDLRMLGFVEDIVPLLSGARVSIAPLRYGAGIKGKVNEAMNYGIPVVATACAVEGMHLQVGEEVLVADEPRAFAEAIARVYGDADLWQRLSAAGVRNVETHFSPKASLPALRRVLGRQ